MKIYFEDGQLIPQSMLPFKCDHAIDASEGYSYCENAMWWLLKNEPDSVVYTNMVTVLSNTFAWNEKEKAPEIYMRNENKEFARIDKIARGQIRYAHNIMAMYRSGVFGNILERYEYETLD
jgi:hypothetical protein